jgi:hypothetical protein
MPYIHQQDYGLPSDAANRITSSPTYGDPLPYDTRREGDHRLRDVVLSTTKSENDTTELFRALSNFYCGDLTKTAKALLLVLEVRDSTKPTIKS